MHTMNVVRVKYVEKNADDDHSIANENPKEVMINIDCPIGLIIDYIRKTAHLEEGEIDLCEETSNQMKNVGNFLGWIRGTEILTPGAVYFIVKIERGSLLGDAQGRVSQVFPLLNGSKGSKIAVDILSRIQVPAGREKRRTLSVTRKISRDKLGGKNAHQEKRNKIGKPASRDTRS